jgi:hypothetical protein
MKRHNNTPRGALLMHDTIPPYALLYIENGGYLNMQSLRQRVAAHPHRGFEVSAVNTGQLSSLEQTLFETGIPLNIIMEGPQAVSDYAREQGIALPAQYEAQRDVQAPLAWGMSNPFNTPATTGRDGISEPYRYSPDDFLG